MQTGDMLQGMEPADRDVVEQVRNGRPEDFRILVERYQRLVFSYLVARVRDRTLAEDAAQEALVRAYFALPKLKKPDSFHAWLLGIAGRVACEFQRSSVRHAETSSADLPAENVENREEYPLDEAIAALPEIHRRLVLLRYYDGLSCQEIADRLGIPLGTVTKTLSRAYAGLRQLLQAQSTTEPRVRQETVL